MPHASPDVRREYQSKYYKSAEQRQRRSVVQQLYMKRLRTRIFERDGYRCRYCKKVFPMSELHVDHVVPRYLNGANVDANRATACAFCNKSKGRKLACEACGSWRRPELTANGHKRCTTCGAVDSFPDYAPSIPENAPPWEDDEDVPESGQLGA